MFLEFVDQVVMAMMGLLFVVAVAVFIAALVQDDDSPQDTYRD